MSKEAALLKAISMYIEDAEAGTTQHFSFQFAGRKYSGMLKINVEEVSL